jgi:hypothetical protein
MPAGKRAFENRLPLWPNAKTFGICLWREEIMIRPHPIPIELTPTAQTCQNPVEECLSVARKRPGLSLGIRVGRENTRHAGNTMAGNMMDRMQATGTPFTVKAKSKACHIFGRRPGSNDWRRASVNA